MTNSTVRKVVAEFDSVHDDSTVFVMWEDGEVEVTTPVKLVKKLDRQNTNAVAQHPDTAVITVIDWRNTPTGWTPPEVKS